MDFSKRKVIFIVTMDTGRIAYKYRLLPDEAQREYLSRCFGCVRFVYNRYVEFSLSEYRRVKAEGGEYRRLPEVSVLKEESPFLREADSLALANAKRNFEAARKAWWDSLTGRRKGRRMRAPAFKKKGKCRDSYTTNNQNGTVAVSEDAVRLPKAGWVRASVHRTIPEDGRVLSATVSRDRDGRYYVSVLVETPDRTPVRKFDPSSLRVVGLDMSLSHFVVSSDPEDGSARTKYVRRYRESERRIRRLNRALHRKVKGSANREKAREALARAHSKVARRRQDFVCKQALHYAREYDVIVLEDIDLQAMSRTLRLGKSVMDTGFGDFRRRLSDKCGEYGSALLYADRWFASSKTCHECGTVNKSLTLSDREWTCPHCGAVLDRDRNAAENLRDFFFKVVDIYTITECTGGTTGIHACGETASTLRDALAQAASLKQESSAGDPEAPSFRWG